jgi:hypothetical protein
MHARDTGLMAQIGSEVVYLAPEPIGAAAFRYFAEAIGDHDPQYRWGDPASGSSGQIAPPTLLFESNHYTGRRPDRNGYSGHTWDGIPPEAVWIRGGNEYRIGRPVRPEDRLRVTWRLVGVRDVTTRDGRDLVQITSEVDFRSMEGDWLGWNREIMFLADQEDQGA